MPSFLVSHPSSIAGGRVQSHEHDVTGAEQDSETLKQESVKQWSAEPAGAILAAAAEEDRDGVRFYEEVERTRYQLYPWLTTYVDDPWWAGKNVLEVGVGLGTDHMRLRRTGAILSGVDLTPASIRHTARRFELMGEETRLVLGDAEHLPFTGGEFDGVYSFGVLHHTPDMSGAINEVHRVLRPGGRAVIGVYNRYSYFHAWRLLRHFARGDWRWKSLAQMRADFEFGEGTPMVRLSSRKELQHAFARFSSVEVTGHHLPTNRLPPALRPAIDFATTLLAHRVGWYWMVIASR